MEYKIVLVRATAKMGYNIDLVKLAKGEKIYYNPEISRALVFPVDGKRFVIFPKGIINFHGHSEKEVEEIAEKLKKLLLKYKAGECV